MQEKQIPQVTTNRGEELKAIVKRTPFERVDYKRWLKRPDFLDYLDKLVQTYADDFSKAKRPHALVMKVGAKASAIYVPYRERQAQAKAAAAKAVAEKAKEKSVRALREAMLIKFKELNEQEKNALLIEASAALGPVLGASRGLVMARALELLRERTELTEL